MQRQYVVKIDDEEHGSAKWGGAFRVNKKYASKLPKDNKLLTQNVRLGLDGNRHRRNLNVLVIGGSGAGKTRFYCKPNLMMEKGYNQAKAGMGLSVDEAFAKIHEDI